MIAQRSSVWTKGLVIHIMLHITKRDYLTEFEELRSK